MKPQISVITLGVDDLERSLRFYRDGLGWKTRRIVGTEFVRRRAECFRSHRPV
ncbi:VOC family protein [Leptospirillum ferriphilum]|uniref:VOC family protein n=1 Tax=Leptospirillum ferriphilum TaxID=178606 RepID=UPI003EE7376E